MAEQNWLVVLVKEPRMGRVKTRLAAGLGIGGATAFYRNTTRDVLRRLGQDPRWRTVLAITPDEAAFDERFASVFPRHLHRLPQGSGDLGARMGRVFETLPHGRAVIIGSDIPGITTDHIARAFKALGAHDAVFGPSDDGGYWLVGQRRTPRVIPMFGQVRWSTEFALEDTLKSLPRGTSSSRLEALIDVDTLEDYRRHLDDSQH